jgi:peptide/nickel transport system substrate-binding protein
MSQKNINRRNFLKMSAAGAVGLAIASCAPAAAPQPAAEPTSPPAAQPQASPTPIPTQAASATPVALAASKYSEAPALEALVASGSLPPVDERLPVSPLVLQPINSIGKYGGRIRSFSGWLGGFWEESQYGHSALRWIDDGMGIAPGMCDTWETNADNTVWTLHIRQGLKWSDGEPCTVEDVLYWWNDLVLNPDHGDQPPDFGTAGGKLAKFEKVDDYTLRISYVEPAPLTAKRLAMWVNSAIGPRWIAPKHYLEQFNPKYNTAVTSFEEHDQKILFRQNPDCPALTPWVCGAFSPAESITWNRNPYYYAVDTEGNQLPYIDGVDEIEMTDREVQLVNVQQGSVDFQHFHGFAVSDIGTLKDREAAGNYEVRLWDSGSGTGQMYFWNYDVKDDKKRELYRDPKFKQAMSFAIDRPTIQRIVYYNTGILTTGTMSPKAIEFNFNAEAQSRYEKYRTAYVAFDPDKAKALLDEIGVVDVNGDGLREYADGTKLDVRVDIASDAGKEALDVLQIVEQNWKEIGLNMIINQIPPAEFGPSWRNGELEFRTNWEVGDGPDHLLYPSWVVPNEAERWAPLSGNMLVVQGTDADGTQCEMDPWSRTPPRWCTDDPQYAGTPVARLHEIYERAKVEVDDMKRHAMVWEMLDIHHENLFYMGTVANYPRIIIVSKNLDNVPTKEQLRLGGFVNPWIIPFPAVTNPETYFFKNV